MLIDANLLLYAVDDLSSEHQRAASWLTAALRGDARVGLPWQSIGAFLRISTHPRIMDAPVSASTAWSHVQRWLAVDNTWIPPATERTAAVYQRLTEQVPITGNLVPDAMLAALAIEHGVVLYSADTDFVRFPGLRWENPLRVT